MNTLLTPGTLSGTITIPSSKSQTIRALLIAAAAEGTSRIINPLDSQDTRSCIAFCTAVGAIVEKHPTYWKVTGIAGTDIRERLAAQYNDEHPLVIDVGNSGTTICLGAGLAASLGIPVVLTGDEQIRSRPVGNLFTAYQDLGARVSYAVPPHLRLESARKPGCPPVMIHGPLKGGETAIACPTSQYLSSLLLAAPLSPNPVSITVTLLNEAPYAEMTMEWLEAQSIPYRHERMMRFYFPGASHFRAFEQAVPGDYSSASFFLCAAAVTGSTLSIKGLRREDSQGDRMLLTWLEQMGCRITWTDNLDIRDADADPDTDTDADVDADVDADGDRDRVRDRVRGSSMKDGAGETVTITGPPRSTAQFSASQHAELQPDRLSDSRPVKPNNRLTGIDIDLNSAPDALPILAVTACFAAGTTRLLNVPQARIKETDRIAVMAAELKRLGADITELEDGLVITGTGRLSGGTVQGHADHRVIMALAVASLAADGPMEILGTDAVDVTFPDFFLLLEAIREKG